MRSIEGGVVGSGGAVFNTNKEYIYISGGNETVKIVRNDPVYNLQCYNKGEFYMRYHFVPGH